MLHATVRSAQCSRATSARDRSTTFRVNALGTADTAPYTALDNAPEARVFRPTVIDVSNVLGGQPPSSQQVAQLRHECEQTGFLAVSGHTLAPAQLQELFTAAAALFDLPLQHKQRYVVNSMKSGRGCEMSPEHQAYMAAWQQRQQQQQQQQQEVLSPAQEPSAAAGILSERFMCGPPLSPQQLQHPYYSNGLGQVFFAPDAWPTAAVPQLQPAMQACYQQLSEVADALLRLFAAALDLPLDCFQPLTDTPTSNMQVASYPSQLPPLPGPNDLRKKAHVDSGTLTLLASDDWQPGSSWQPGQGGLQLLSPQGEWLEVAVPPGTLLCNLGSIMTHWTGGQWKSTLHRVTNPPPSKAGSSRRLSVALFHKPNYDALIQVLDTCRPEFEAAAGVGGWQGDLLYPPMLAADLTRQGILHRYRHLPPEEASAAYHAELARRRGL